MPIPLLILQDGLPPFFAFLPAGLVDENLPYSADDGHEMVFVGSINAGLINPFHINLMYKHRFGQGDVVVLILQLLIGKAFQLIIHQREELIVGLVETLLNFLQQLGDPEFITHNRSNWGQVLIICKVHQVKRDRKCADYKAGIGEKGINNDICYCKKSCFSACLIA